MSIKERVQDWLGIGSAASVAPTRPPAIPTLAISSKGRQSADDPTQSLFPGLSYLLPFSADDRWRALIRSRTALDEIPTADLLELLTEVSPDVSRALWDLLRLCNPGHTTRALTLGPDEVVHAQGQQLLDDFEAQIGHLYGSFNVVINRLFADAFLRGSFVAELVLDAAGRAPLDLATPDGRWIYFEIYRDPLRGPVWQPFQWIYGEKVVLDRPTFRYVPVDPLPGKPIGRAICSPAIFTSLFVMGLLHDLRRVVAQQGYPRIDISISLEELAKSMPPDVAADPEQMRIWLTSAVKDIGNAFDALEPDSTFVHTDVSTVNRPVGTLDSNSLGAVDGLLRAMDRFLVRALKTAPFLMGSNESVSETHANRQYENHMAGIESLQQLCENLLEHMYNLVLRAAGIPAKAQFRFKISRRSELFRDEQAKQLRINNAAVAYARGWLSQEGACQMALDQDVPDQPEPRIPTAGIASGGGAAPGNPATAEPSPGVNRLREMEERLMAQIGNGNGRG